MSSFTINPMNLVRTLSMALDLVVDGVNMHQMRTAAICRCISEAMVEPLAQQTLLNAALLHDIGAAPDHDKRRRLVSPSQEEGLGRNIYGHAERGWELLRPCALPTKRRRPCAIMTNGRGTIPRSVRARAFPWQVGSSIWRTVSRFISTTGRAPDFGRVRWPDMKTVDVNRTLVSINTPCVICRLHFFAVILIRYPYGKCPLVHFR